MADRGEVMQLKKRVGFAPHCTIETMLILQCDGLNRALSTTIAAPLDDALAMYRGDPTCVALSATEAGSDGPRVALLTRLRTVPWDAFEPSPVGRHESTTLAVVEAAMCAIFDL